MKLSEMVEFAKRVAMTSKKQQIVRWNGRSYSICAAVGSVCDMAGLIASPDGTLEINMRENMGGNDPLLAFV